MAGLTVQDCGFMDLSSRSRCRGSRPHLVEVVSETPILRRVCPSNVTAKEMPLFFAHVREGE